MERTSDGSVPVLSLSPETAILRAMATFPFDDKYTATATPYRHGDGFVMKGTLFYNSKPKETFEVYGRTISAAEDAAHAEARKFGAD